MRERELGEVLLRPSAAHRGRAVCVVKMGAGCVGNWVLREDRRPDGAFYFLLRDNVVDQRLEFAEIDEFINNYVGPMVGIVQGIRTHRRFVENVREVPGALEDQHRMGRGFAYAFAEMGTVSKPPLYCIFTSGAGKRYRFNLHFTNSAVYMRLPVYRPSSPTRTQYVWVECRNAEQLSQAVKKHASQN
ncbi:unnamed protein product [Phytomonas sp. Hart1]|nr:unnamed protein product [Phytomonas sp. Hart1]|eukprot:CCW69358.1 unnamed protein product [Phytomonas sp. isolate Hart1]